jgi:hypothetical protein
MVNRTPVGSELKREAALLSPPFLKLSLDPVELINTFTTITL